MAKIYDDDINSLLTFVSFNFRIPSETDNYLQA
jgi:hypothetical protein